MRAAPFSRCRFRRRLRSGARGGFTLLELLAVIAIIAILASFGLALMQGAKRRAAMARARSELAILSQALEEYKRYYGDYPRTGAAAPAPPVIAGPIAAGDAQTLLFNALTGVYGPTDFSVPRPGPIFVELSRLRLEVPLAAGGTAAASPVVANCFLDPWGNRYLYFYKAAHANGAGSVGWRAPAYVLYSAGADGRHVAPDATTGLFSGMARTTGINADNLYASQ